MERSIMTGLAVPRSTGARKAGAALAHLTVAAIMVCGALGAAPTLAAKDTLTLAVGLEPPHLDPTAGAAAAIDEVVYANLFEGLTRIDSTGAVQPALAESWEVSPDGLVYTFALRQGATFHDGSAFDADDVLFSLDRARGEDSTNAQKRLFAPIATVEKVDAHTVRVTLKHAAGDFLFSLGWGDAVMIAPETADTNKNEPVGTGPFAFERWIKGDSVVLTRRDAYWGTPPALNRVTFKFIEDASAQVNALLAGDVDAMPNIGAPEMLDRFKGDGRFAVQVGSTEGETILAINNGQEPFDDILVRRAIAHAINRQDIIDGAMFGFGTPIGTHFAPHHPAYIDLTDRYPFDPERARELLAEAGWPDGFEASLKLPPPSYARRGGEVIAAQLATVGISVRIEPVEWAQWLDRVFKQRDYDLTIVSHTEPLDIEIYGRDDYYFDYHSNAFRGIMQQLQASAGTEARYALFGAAQRAITEDAVNAYLFQLAKHGVWAAGLEGLWANSPVQANDVTGVRWAR